MRFAAFISLTLLAASATSALAGSDAGDSDYHGDPRRSGNFVVPTLTQASAATLKPSMGFHGIVMGSVPSQPLYLAAPRSDERLHHRRHRPERGRGARSG